MSAARRMTNTPPLFPDQDLNEETDVQKNQTREVAENTPAGTNLGAPIAANDDPGDVLTYSLDANGAMRSTSSTEKPGQPHDQGGPGFRGR